MQIDLHCDKCGSEIKTRQVGKGTLLCRCPKCGYKFRLKISNVEEMEIAF